MIFQIKKGEIISNEYQIKEKLGEGGISVVYRAGDKKYNRDVALKFLKQNITSSYIEDTIRFKREIEVISQLTHPHIIRLHGAGEYRNTPYLIEELLEGESLSDLIQNGERFKIKEAVEIIRQITEGLDYMHKNGIIHRDIKAGNIVIAKRDKKNFVKIIDFGLSNVIELSRIKNKKEVIETFGYMSPEATGIVNKKIDERSDLYSLGIIFYQLLTNELPFTAEEMSKLLHLQVAVMPSKLREINSDIPKILEEIVIKLLYKEPELRYQSAKGLVHDLEKVQKGEDYFNIGERDQKVKLVYQTRLIGREEELKKLKEIHHKVQKKGGQICLIGGEAGVGKTRLAEEMKEYLYEQGYEKGGLFIQGRCFNQENKNPYQPFIDALNEYIKKIGKIDKKDRDKEIKRIKEVLGDLGKIIIKLNSNMKEIVGETAELVSLDSERENQRFLMVVSDFFCYLAEKGKSYVLFIDDLQWADEGSLSVLEEIAGKINNTNLLIIGTYRDNEIGEGHSLNRIKKEAGKNEVLEEIKLIKFGQNQLKKLSAGILGEKEEKAEKITEYIYEKSGGNPFFSIIILRELIEENAISWKEGYWKEDWEKIEKIKISENIIDLVLKRIEDLEEKEVRLLCVSSIIGKEFEIELLYLLLDYGEEKIIELIDELINLQLIEKSKERGKVIFVHDRIREAFLRKVGEKERRKIHINIAKVIEEKNKGREDAVIFELANHYTEGGEKEKSLKYVIPAAEKSKENYANEEAIRYYRKGIELLGEGWQKRKQEWIKVKEELAEVYLTTGRSDEAIVVLKEILPLKKSPLEKAKVYRKIGNGYFKKGSWKRCEDVLAQGLKLLGEKIPRKKGSVIFFLIKEVIIHLFHSIFSWIFSHKISKKIKEENKEIIRFYYILNWMYGLSDVIKLIWVNLKLLNFTQSKVGQSKELGIALTGYACLCMAIPLFKRSIKYHEKALKLRKELKDEWGVAQLLQFLGFCYSWKGEHEKSRNLFQQSIEKFQRIGDIWELGMTVNGLAHEDYYSDNFDKSIASYNQYLAISQKIKDDYGISSALQDLAYCYGKKGDFGNAEAYIQKSLVLSKKREIWFGYCNSNTTFGWLELERSNYNKALKYFLIALKLNDENDFLKDYTVNLYYYLAEAYIEKFKIQSSGFKIKIYKQEIKKIKAACKKALSQTKKWVNHYSGSLRVNGKYYALIKKYKKAEGFYLKSIKVAKSLKFKYDEAKSCYEYGLFLKNLKKTDNAKEKWQHAYMIFKEIGAKAYIKRCSDLLDYKIEDIESDTAITKQDRLKTERRMRTVLNTSQYLSSIFDLNELLEKIMNSTIELLGAERGALFLYPDEDERRMRQLEIKVVREAEKDIKSSTILVSRKILARVEEGKAPLIIKDASVEPEFKEEESIIKTGLKSVLCVPIMIKGEMLGVIYLDSHLVSSLFTKDDLQVLELLASQSGVSIQNARLYKKSIAKERMENDLQIASQIQKYFLPKKIEKIKKLAINTSYIPAEFIGGDYYDIVKINKNKYGIIIADVSGHGSSAAIVMSVVSFIFHSAIEKVKGTSQLMEIISRRLDEMLQGEKFATGIFIIYDQRKDKFEYSNAGHIDMLVYRKRKDKVEEVKATGGMPLGIMPDLKYKSGEFQLQTGDVLLLQTDGLHETMNTNKDLFSMKKVKDLLYKFKGENPQQINEKIIAETSRFRGDIPQQDDIALITIKKTG